MKNFKISIKLLVVALLVPVVAMLLTSMTLITDTDNAKSTTVVKTQETTTNYLTLDKLPLNRKARNINRNVGVLAKGVKARYPMAHTGFLFDSKDNRTKKWRPQGIAGTAVKGKKFIIVSWYGRGDYKNRGGRISVVNVTNMKNIKYRHILLLDKNGQPMPNCHVGGLAIVGNKLHTVDSRGNKNNPNSYSGTYDQGLVFDLTKIEKLATPILKYSYVLKCESTYDLPFNPSYISYDKDAKQLFVGSFQCCPGVCNIADKKPTKLCWFDPATVNRNTPYSTPFRYDDKLVKRPLKKKVCEVQGAATVTRDGKKYLITASSFSPILPSRINVFVQKKDKWDWMDVTTPYAPGLEDVYISSKNVWTLSEFSPTIKEAVLNDRAVVAIKINRILTKAKAAYIATKAD